MAKASLSSLILAVLLLGPVAALAQTGTAAKPAPQPAVQPKGLPIMSPQEEAAHEEKMHSFKTYEACKAYFTEHLQKIEARAKAEGRSLRNIKRNECEDMRDKGAFAAK